ncbi:MAG: hypothetical protein KGL44_03685 [Sphingomonadales bacterium]|nr:hypothetical protein [Sphingomonadales bacterium]
MPVADGTGAPEWIHLLPAGPAIETADGRGPYFIKSLQAIASRLLPGEKLPLDECHSSDRAAPLGQPAPARGWIVALEARGDGLWGKVEWTGEGQRLMEDKAYRGVSPAILHSQDNTIVGVLRASLINTPNLLGLCALHSEGGASEENGMDWKAKLIELLGLDGSADDAAIEAALSAKMAGGKVELCGQNLLENPTVIALQGQLTDVTGQLNAMRDERKRDAATAFVDAAIAQGKVGVQPARDEYIALHMQDADRAVKMVAALPALQGKTHAGDVPPTKTAGALDDADRQVIALMGMSEEDYVAGLKAAGTRKETL